MDQWSTVRWLVLRILILTGIPFPSKLLKNEQYIFYFSSLFHSISFLHLFSFFPCLKRWCYVCCQSWLVKLHKRVTEGLPSSRFIFSINTRWKEKYENENCLQLKGTCWNFVVWCGSFTRSLVHSLARSNFPVKFKCERLLHNSSFKKKLSKDSPLALTKGNVRSRIRREFCERSRLRAAKVLEWTYRISL